MNDNRITLTKPVQIALEIKGFYVDLLGICAPSLQEVDKVMIAEVNILLEA